MHVSDDLYLGPVQTKMSQVLDPTLDDLGVGPLGRVYIFDVVPATAAANNLATTQNPGSGASFTLTAGAGVTARVRADGTTEYVLDTPRAVRIVAAGANSATYTVTGFDQYGQRMSETLAAPSTSTVTTTKTFRTIISITNANATAGTNGLTVGTADVIGLPIRLLTRDYVVSCTFNQTAVALSAVTAADTTSPATTTTDDVRGTVTLPSASDGVKRLVMAIAVPGIACGPFATRVGALGVDQV